MRVVISGCGRVGAALAEMLSLERHQVTVVDRDPASFSRLSKVFKGEAVEGVGFDEETMEKAGIREADAFVAVTNFDNANLMAAEVARHVFHVPYTLARVYNPDKEDTYHALGMDYICGTRLVAQAVMEKLLKPLVRVKGLCANNTQHIVEFDYPGPWKGKTSRQLKEDPGLVVAWVERGGRAVFPGKTFVFRVGDVVTALVSERGLRRLERKLSKTGRW